MKKLVQLSILTVIVILFLHGQGWAQIDGDLAAYYQTYGSKTAKENLDANVEPLLNVFGYYTGSALYNTAEVHGMLGFDVGIKTAIVLVGDNLKSDWAGSQGVAGGPLGDYNAIPLPVLHVGFGLGSNVELIGRAFSYPIAETADGEATNISLVGVGIKYGIVQSLLLPRISVIAAYHRLIIPEEYDFEGVQTLSLDLMISKGIPFFATFYGGVGIDRSSMTVNLKPLLDESFDYSSSLFSGVVGIKFDFIPFVYLSADYNFGANRGVNLGAGINFR